MYNPTTEIGFYNRDPQPYNHVGEVALTQAGLMSMGSKDSNNDPMTCLNKMSVKDVDFVLGLGVEMLLLIGLRINQAELADRTLCCP